MVFQHCFGYFSGIILWIMHIVPIKIIVDYLMLFISQVSTLFNIFHTYIFIVRAISCMVALHVWIGVWSLKLWPIKGSRIIIAIIPILL